MKGLKSKSANTLVWILMAMLIFGLGGFGITNFGGGVTTIGSVGDSEIDVNDYARALQQELAAAGAQLGQPLTLEQGLLFGIDRTVRARLVTSASLDNETKRIGISAGDARLRDEILQMPSFSGLNGKFDRELYKQTLRQNGLNESRFEAKARSDIARTVLQGAVAAAARAPQNELDLVFAWVGETRSADVLTLTEAHLATPIAEPTDAELAAYHAAHAEDFTRPEAKRITYAALLPDMLADKVSVDEDALRALYDERIDDFVQPERRLVERLVFGTQEDAAAAAAQIASGATSFDTLVTDRGLTLDDVDLGDVSAADLGPAAEAVFALEQPGVAGPVTTDLGPALIRVNAILEAQETSFEDARDDLMSEFVQDAARRMIGDRVETIDDALAGGATLEELASDEGMEIAQIDYYAGVAEGIAGYEAFRAAADALQSGDFPEAVLLDDGGVVALRFEEILAPELRPLDTVRDEVANAWHAAALTDSLTAEADSIVTRIAAGETLGSFGMVTSTGAQTRGGQLGALPDTVLAAMFEMDQGALRTVAGDGEVHVVRLTGIAAATTADADSAALRAAIGQRLDQTMADDVFALFAAALQADTGISLNQTAIEAVHAQFR